MSEDYNFQKELKKSIINVDPRLDKKDVLEDIFKTYVAKMFELVLAKSKDPEQGRIEFDAMVQIKRNLISEFRDAELGEHQRSVEWYEDLFDATIQEIFNDAALAHKGVNNVAVANQNLEINPEAYVNEGGLYVPEHMKGH